MVEGDHGHMIRVAHLHAPSWVGLHPATVHRNTIRLLLRRQSENQVEIHHCEICSPYVRMDHDLGNLSVREEYGWQRQ